MDKNMPETPYNAQPAITDTMKTNALFRTLDDAILGQKKYYQLIVQQIKAT